MHHLIKTATLIPSFRLRALPFGQFLKKNVYCLMQIGKSVNNFYNYDMGNLTICKHGHILLSLTFKENTSSNSLLYIHNKYLPTKELSLTHLKFRKKVISQLVDLLAMRSLGCIYFRTTLYSHEPVWQLYRPYVHGRHIVYRHCPPELRFIWANYHSYESLFSYFIPLTSQ